MKKIIVAVAIIIAGLGLWVLVGPALADNHCVGGGDICWKRETTYYGIVRSGARPTFVDIDDDGDQDLFIGDSGTNIDNLPDGTIAFYQNIGTPLAPQWQWMTNIYNDIVFGLLVDPTPTFVDIDADGDQDLFIGKTDGTISFYRNIGTPRVAKWPTLLISPDYEYDYAGIDVGFKSAPAFVDIDKDGDQDLFIGAVPSSGNATIYFYRNIGNYKVARWEALPETPYQSKVGLESYVWLVPVFVDIDADGDHDLFIGGNWASG